MDIPTDLVAAARVLVASANPPLELPADGGPGFVSAEDRTDNPTPWVRDGDPEVVDTYTAWLAITPRTFGRLERISRERQRANGVDHELPEVVRVGDARGRTEPLVSRPVRAEQRPRFVVPPLRPAGAPRRWLSTPGEAHAVTLGGLSARLAADRLEAWIPTLLAGEARTARAEVAAYRTYAAAATDQLPGLFAWVALVPEPVPAFAPPPTVQTVLTRMGRESF